MSTIRNDLFRRGISFFIVAGLAPATWAQCVETRIGASDADQGDWFGTSVALAGQTALIGADMDDHAGGTEAGSAYVSVRSGTVWVEQAKLTASDAEPFDRFGFAVAISGETAFVGSYLDDDDGGQSGSVYVFVRSGTVWTEQAKLTASDADAGDSFGYSVSIFGDSILVGAALDDDDGDTSGSAYVFVRSGASWIERLEGE